MKVVRIAKADGFSSKTNSFFKKLKNRYERRRAKRDPECIVAYRRYRGFIS